MNKKSIICLLLIFISISSFAQQTTLEKAWENFKINKIAESRKYFTEATKENPQNAEAYLMLSLLATIDKTPDEALNHFIKFTDVTTEDINPYLRALWYTESVANGIKTKINEPRVAFMTKLLESGKLNPTTRAYALETLGDHYKYSNNLKKSDEYFRQIGSVINWQITGTFDNISGSGFDKVYGPIAFAHPDSIFTNNYQAPVKWFEMKETQPGRWLDLTHHFITDNSVIYAQTFCNSPGQQDVVIRIGTSGSLKNWINDKLMFSEADERNNGTDTYAFTARLNKGYNRILLQIGSSEIDRSNFLVRITDIAGNNLENLTFSSSYHPYEADTSDFQNETIPNFADAYFIHKIEKSPDNLLYYMLLTSSYLANDKTYFAQKTVQNAQKLAPDCSFILSQLIEIYARNENWTEYGTALEDIKEIDPENPRSLRLLYNEAIKKKDYEEAKKIIDKIEKIFGKDEYVIRRQLEIEAVEKRNENYYRLLNEAYNKFPENITFVYWKFLAEKERTKNTAKAANILKRCLDQEYNFSINYYYVEAFFETGHIKKGLKYLNKIIEFEPSAVGYYYFIGKVYYNLRDYKNAIKYFEKCSELAPYNGDIYKYLAKCWYELGDPKKAITYYNKALMYDPNDYESREELRKLENKPPVFSYFETPDLYQLYKDSPTASDYPGESCIILFKEAQKVVYGGGGSQEKVYMLIKVFNSDGIDRWKELEIPFENNQSLIVEKAEVIKKNGTKVKAEIKDDQVVFTSLEAGDAISLIYKLNTYETGKFMKHFTDEFYFSSKFPIKTAKYFLLISPDIKFNHMCTNSDLKPEITTKGDFELYKWAKHNIPAVKYENYMPSLCDIGEVLFLSTYPDWNFLTEWYADLTNNQLKSDFYIQEKAKELFAEKSNLSQLEKAKVIYNYVTKEIRYSSVPFRQSGLIPQKPSEVISTRLGDCKDVSTLFVALCREVGLEANLVLVNPREYGKNETLLPSFPFDHSIAQVNIDGEDYYVELTSDIFSFATLPPEIYKSQVLPIKDSKGQTVAPFTLDPPTMVKNTIVRNLTVEFDNDKMKIKTDSEKTGWHAADIRDAYKNISIEERNKNMTSNITSEYADAELVTLKFDDNLENPENELTYHIEYLVNNVFTRINKMEIFRIPFTDNITTAHANFGNSREFPLEYWNSYRCQDFYEYLTIKIPEGKQLVEIPDNVEYKNKILHYQITFKVEHNMLIAVRKLKFTNDVISTEEYPEFKELFAKIINADAMQIAFK